MEKAVIVHGYDKLCFETWSEKPHLKLLVYWLGQDALSFWTLVILVTFKVLSIQKVTQLEDLYYYYLSEEFCMFSYSNPFSSEMKTIQEEDDILVVFGQRAVFWSIM